MRLARRQRPDTQQPRAARAVPHPGYATRRGRLDHGNRPRVDAKRDDIALRCLAGHDNFPEPRQQLPLAAAQIAGRTPRKAGFEPERMMHEPSDASPFAETSGKSRQREAIDDGPLCADAGARSACRSHGLPIHHRKRSGQLVHDHVMPRGLQAGDDRSVVAIAAGGLIERTRNDEMNRLRGPLHRPPMRQAIHARSP
jgi:hypothetical protein